METSSSVKQTSYVFQLAFVAAVGGFLFGFDLGMIGAANVFLRDQFQLTNSELGFATASAVLGCVFGPSIGVWLCDAISRKRTMLVAAALLAISAIFTAAPDALGDGSRETTLFSFNLFRFVGGLGVGLCSIASPMYIAEIAPASKRGQLGLMYQLAIVLGHAAAPLAALAIVYFLRVQFGVTESIVSDNPWLQPWRWMFFSEMICVLGFVSFVIRLPFSPRWLAEKGRIAQAEEVLNRIEGPEYARREMQQIKTALAEENGTWREVFSPGIRYALGIGILLAFFNNWTGWSVIAGYIPLLLELAGFSRESAIGNFVAVYVAMGLVTCLSILLTDRVGRRPLWQFASVLMGLITFMTGYLFYQEATGWPILILLGLVTIPHGIALGGLPWLMMSELFPTRIRAKAVGITTSVLWIFIFAGAYLFPPITGYAQRHFLTERDAVVSSDTISFSQSPVSTINDSEGNFIQAGFRDGDVVTVMGARNAANNGNFNVTEVAEKKLTLNSAVKIVNENEGSDVTVQVGNAGAAFWLFSVICVLSFIFGISIMPETKGRTLEDIGSSWQKHAET